MELRGYTVAEVRKGRSVTKGPDLSAFPIPRKGGAKPIAMDEAAEVAAVEEQSEGKGAGAPEPPPRLTAATVSPPTKVSREAARPVKRSQPIVAEEMTAAPASSGQTVATTVKLDENRYLRLADAGKPGPGRLKRRTIQEMVIEALDEWFERRRL